MFATPQKQAELRERIDKYGTAEKLAEALKVNKGLVSRALNDGYVAPALARALGWPVEITVVCPNPKCNGDEHSFDCRNHQVKPKPTKRPKRKRRPYKNIDPTDPAQVQRQIAKYMPGWKLVKEGEQ